MKAGSPASPFLPMGACSLRGAWSTAPSGCGSPTGAMLRVLQGCKDWISSVAFSPDGRMLAAGTGTAWSGCGSQTQGLRSESSQGHEGGPERRLFARRACSPSGLVTIPSGWQPNSGAPLRVLQGHA